MQDILKTLIRLSWLLLPTLCFAQSTSLPLQSKHRRLLERLEMLMQDNNELNISTFKPISRQLAARVGTLADSLHTALPYDEYAHLTPVDRANLRSLLMNNIEWTNASPDSFKSKRSLWNTFYKTPADFFMVNEKDFFLSVNPVLQQQQSIETGTASKFTARC